MLFGNIRRDMHSDYQTNSNASYLLSPLPTPLSASSTITRTPATPQTAMTNYARMPYRYTTVCEHFVFVINRLKLFIFLGNIVVFTTTTRNYNIS